VCVVVGVCLVGVVGGLWRWVVGGGGGGLEPTVVCSHELKAFVT